MSNVRPDPNGTNLRKNTYRINRLQHFGRYSKIPEKPIKRWGALKSSLTHFSKKWWADFGWAELVFGWTLQLTLNKNISCKLIKKGVYYRILVPQCMYLLNRPASNVTSRPTTLVVSPICLVCTPPSYWQAVHRPMIASEYFPRPRPCRCLWAKLWRSIAPAKALSMT